MAPAVDVARAAAPARSTPATRGVPAAVQRRRRASVDDGARGRSAGWSTRSATRCAGTCACETFADLGVTGLIELPPAGTLVGLAKRALPGVETLAAEDPRRPRRGPAAGPRARRQTAAAAGDARPTRKRPDMTHTSRPRGTGSSPRPAATYARILGVGGYRPERVVTNDEIIERIDSSDEWIRERSGIISRRWAAPRRDRRRHVRGGRPRGARRRRARRRPTSARSSSRPSPTPTRPRRPPRCSPHRLGATRPRPSTSPPPAPASATASAWPTTWSAAAAPSYVLVVGVEKLSDFTDPTDRGTAFIFGDGAGAVVVGPSDDPGIGPTVWGSDGAQWEAISQTRPLGRGPRRRQASSWPAHHACRARRCSAGPCGRWRRSPSRRWTPPASRADDLDAFIPHQANMRIIDAMVKQLRLPARRPRRPRHRDDRQHLGRVHPAGHGADARARARRRTAAWPC